MQQMNQKSSYPLRLIQDKDRSAPWWCYELEHIRKLPRKAFDKAKNSKLDEVWNTYKVDFKEYRKVRKIKDRLGKHTAGKFRPFRRALIKHHHVKQYQYYQPARKSTTLTHFSHFIVTETVKWEVENNIGDTISPKLFSLDLEIIFKMLN